MPKTIYKGVEVLFAMFMALYIGSMLAFVLLAIMNGLSMTFSDLKEFGQTLGYANAPFIYYGTINVLALTFYILWSKYNEA